MKKSIFLFFAAILCATNTWGAKLFFDHSSVNYPADGALVAIWSWGGSSSDAWSVFKASGATNKIVADIADGRTGGKIVRFQNSVTKPDWNAAKWNETGDISFPSDKNCIKITSWDGATTGTWSTFQLESQASITPSASSVSVGEEVTFTPALTSNQEYNDVLSTTYSVGAGATITDGKFVATEAGTYTVTATVTYNAKGYTNITKTATATCSITVSAVAVPHPVTGVTVAPTSVTIKQGATTTLTATVAPSNADDPSVTWSSDNQSVATVVNGVVTAVAVGTANITVTTVDGGFTATCAVKVKPSQYTFYAINSAQWPTVAAHYWGGADGGSSWPGADMVKEPETINGFDIYSITISSDFINIMFTNQLDGEDNKKTEDLTTEGYNGKYYDIKGAKWYASLSEVPVSYDYYVIGTVNGWALGDANYGMTDDNADGVYEKVVTLADGKNQMKINNGTWDKQAGYDQLDAKYEGVSRGKDGDDNNIIIDITPGKDITVKFDKNANKITLDGLTKIEDYYTVVGVAELFGEAWATANEANKMVKQGDGSYKLVKENVTLAAIGYEWKIAKNGDWWNDAATGVNPSSGNNTLTITTAGRYNVTFTLSANLQTATAETELLEAIIVIPDCYISGNATLTGGKGWQGNEFTMVYDEETETWAYTLAGLQPEKEYELKVVCGGTWYNYADLASIPTGVTEGNDHSIAFKMAAAGDVVVTYNVEAGITLSGNFAEPVTYVTVVDATVSTGTYSIDLAGTWEERTVTIQLWQDNVQGFGEYAANAETGYTCQLGNPYAELTPTTAGVYADNGDGTFTFTATMTDTDGGIYNISVTGAIPADEPEVPTALDNVTTTVAPVKAIVNGQLVIVKDGVKYNAQGAVVK